MMLRYRSIARVPTRLAAVAVVALVAATALAAAEPPIRLVSRAPALAPAVPWTAVLAVSGPGRPVLTARLGARSVTFRSTAAGRGRFRVRVVLPTAGRWRLSAVVGGRRFALGTIVVRAPSYRLVEPAQIIVAGDGSLLVAERGNRDRILRIEPATGRVTTFLSGLAGPYGLALERDGSVLVSSGGAILRAPASGGRAETVADVEAGPIAVSGQGELYAAGRDFVGRVERGRLSRYAVQVDAPHALVLGTVT